METRTRTFATGVALLAVVGALSLGGPPARAEQHGDGYGPRDADPREYGGGQGHYVVAPYVVPLPYGVPPPYRYGPPVAYAPPPYAYRFPYAPPFRPLPPLRPPYPYAPYPYAPYPYPP